MTQLFPLPSCRLVRVVRHAHTAITLIAEAKRDHARCPACRAVSTSVHSRYRRRPTDLPASGEAVRLQLEVRRFYCRDPACPRQTFAERVSKLLARHAQRTSRLAEAQRGRQARRGRHPEGVPQAPQVEHAVDRERDQVHLTMTEASSDRAHRAAALAGFAPGPDVAADTDTPLSPATCLMQSQTAADRASVNSTECILVMEDA